MTDRITIQLFELVQAWSVLREQGWPWIKARILDGHRLILELRMETRSDAQNRLLHGWIRQIAKQMDWAGTRRDPETWKRLLTASWLRARGESVEILPALDGHGIDVVFRPTSKLTRSECAELSEYVMAWADEHGVEWRKKGDRPSVDPETGEILEHA